MLRARLASAEAAFDVARVRVARMMYMSIFIRDVKEAIVIEEERTSLALFIGTNEHGTEKAATATHRTDLEWVLNSGASKHVAR